MVWFSRGKEDYKFISNEEFVDRNIQELGTTSYFSLDILKTSWFFSEACACWDRFLSIGAQLRSHRQWLKMPRYIIVLLSTQNTCLKSTCHTSHIVLKTSRFRSSIDHRAGRASHEIVRLDGTAAARRIWGAKRKIYGIQVGPLKTWPSKSPTDVCFSVTVGAVGWRFVGWGFWIPLMRVALHAHFSSYFCTRSAVRVFALWGENTTF